MQEQNASKSPSFVARFGVKNITWLSLFSVMMLAIIISWFALQPPLRTASWREADSTLPWNHEGLRVQSVTGHWLSAAGNERMALRTTYYPLAEIELAEGEGSGMLYISFTDSNGRQAGDTITLHYDKGNFLPRNEVNISIEGNKARVHIETGYDKEDDFTLHQMDESQELWRINLRCRPEGAHQVQDLGYVTIPAQLQS